MNVQHIDFYFDPRCPWAYQTSVWIREVRKLRGLDISWKFFSLEEINLVEGKKHPWEREIAYGWTPMRVAAWLRRISMTKCDEWYEVVGHALHVEGLRPYEREVGVELLSRIGEPASTWDEALADPSTHDDVRADHDHAVSEYAAFGVPILVFPNNRAIFGPVVVPAPAGDDALRLWDLADSYSSFPGLFEFKTPKIKSDQKHIAQIFAPTSRASQ